MATTGTVIRSRPTLQAPVPAALVIATADDPENPIEVRCEQAGPIIIRPPQPRYQVIDRPGRVGVPEWVGQDPYELVTTIRLDGYPDTSVEPQIQTLESFAEVWGGRPAPPVLTVEGAIPNAHPRLKWCLSDIADPDELLFLPGGQQRSRYVATLTFTQHVDANELEENLRATRAARGIRTRTTRVREGEDLYAVARRFYRNPARASDIAQANFQNGRPLRLGQKLKAGTLLRMPS